MAMDFAQFESMLNEVYNKVNDEECLLNALSRDVSPIQYTAVDEETELKLVLDLPGIESHPEDRIDIDIRPWSLEVKIRGFAREYCLKICRFAAKINVARSLYLRTGGMVVFKLDKVTPGKWDHFSYHHPKILKNFNSSLDEYVKSSPVLQDRDNSHLFSIWMVETLSNIGVEFRHYLTDSGVNLPLTVITIEQILEFLKSRIGPSSTEKEFVNLAVATFLYEKNKFEETHPEVMREYDKRPKSKKLLNKLAEIWRLKGTEAVKYKEHFEAIEAFTVAIKMDSQNATYYLDRGIVYYDLELIKNSFNDIGEAIALNPFYGKAHFYLGKCLLAKGLPEDANEVFRKVKILDPHNREVDEQIREVYKYESYVGMYVEALRCGDDSARETHLKSIITIVNPSIASQTLINLLCKKGMICEARKEANNLSCVHRDGDYMTFSFLAICSYYEDDEANFQENFQRAKEISPASDEEYCDDIAEIYDCQSKGNESFTAGCYDDAVMWYLQGLENGEIIPVIASKLYYKLAGAYCKLDNTEDAILSLNSAIEKKGDYIEAYVTRGHQFMKQNQFEEAAKDFEKAFELLPSDYYQELINIAKSKHCLENKTLSDDSHSGKSSTQDNDESDTKFQMQKCLALSVKEKGNEQFESQLYKEAIVSYSEAIQLDPENPVYYSNRAACHIMLKNFNEGLRDSKKAASLDPSFAKGLFRLGQCHIAFGSLDEAAAALEMAKKLKGTDKKLQAELIGVNVLREIVNRGDSALSAKDFTAAEQYYTTAVARAEVCIRFRLKRIECLIHLEKFKEAFAEAELCTSLDPDRYEIFYFMGICSFNQMDNKRAISYIEKSLSLCPIDERLYGVLKLLRDYEKSIRKASKQTRTKLFLETQKKLWDSGVGGEEEEEELKSEKERGDDYFAKSLHKDAMACYTVAISQEPENSELYIQRASCYMVMNNFHKALADSKEALGRENKCLKVFIILGQCNTIIGNVEEAISAFETAKKLDSSNKNVVKGVNKALKLKNALKDAELAFKEENFSDAYSMYKCASRIARRNPGLLLNMAECLINLQKLLELSRLINSVNRDLRQSPEYFCIKGLDIFHSIYNQHEATILIQTAIDIDPSNEKYQKYLIMIKSVYEKMTKGFYLLRIHDFPNALSVLQEGLEVESNNRMIEAELNYYIGVIKLKQSNVVEAVECFSKSIDMREDYFSALEKRAWCYKKLNRFKDAVEDYTTLYKCTSVGTYKEIADDLRAIGRRNMNIVPDWV